MTQCLRQFLEVVLGGGSGELGSTQMLNSYKFHIMMLGLYPRGWQGAKGGFKVTVASPQCPLVILRSCSLYAACLLHVKP